MGQRLKKKFKENHNASKSLRYKRRGRFFSSITRRILAINVLALGFLVIGILYLDKYKNNLINAELSGLLTQAEIFAVALSEGAVAPTPSGLYRGSKISDQIVRRLVQATGIRARLFGVDGRIIADSRRLIGPGGVVSVEILPPPEGTTSPLNWILELLKNSADQILGTNRYPVYEEKLQQSARDYDEVISALSGKSAKTIRFLNPDKLLLGVAVPVQRYKKILGGLLVTKDSERIDIALYETRRDILKVFVFALALTVLLSMYLAGTIARPLRILADAAERVRLDHHRHHRIPNMADRNDEIGELASTLDDMTNALWQRIDAIDQFAADVAHEIKNPLTSLRSAVETTARLKDPKQQHKLMSIIQEDVGRLDRLISDISDASRLDAELSRAENKQIDIADMLATMVDIHNITHSNRGPRAAFAREGGAGALMVMGLEGRLAQIFQNLITNAKTFSPGDGIIQITVSSSYQNVLIHVDDEGQGIPAGNERKIFNRFYTERPETEKFGTHSGLGLSISQQIVHAHHGEIYACNRYDGSGTIIGARFTVSLPLA